ncbi:hypothetical protein CDAR_240931 [Caerostris darwini]|uniref:Uncharacterized protein n=1 Tax=Caerostris darwini TaxID=1538125 RepID=A0AAV4TE74_9ARAC|nr:hypothetical protein CDAR_240931 [Caerostris darwini]
MKVFLSALPSDASARAKTDAGQAASEGQSPNGVCCVISREKGPVSLQKNTKSGIVKKHDMLEFSHNREITGLCGP